MANQVWWRSDESDVYIVEGNSGTWLNAALTTIVWDRSRTSRDCLYCGKPIEQLVCPSCGGHADNRYDLGYAVATVESGMPNLQLFRIEAPTLLAVTNACIGRRDLYREEDVILHLHISEIVSRELTDICTIYPEMVTCTTLKVAYKCQVEVVIRDDELAVS